MRCAPTHLQACCVVTVTLLAAALLGRWCRKITEHACASAVQAANKKKVSKDDWERKLSAVELPKEDLNQLVMNFLVTEVRSCAEVDSATTHTAAYARIA